MVVLTKDVVKCRDEFWKNLHLLRADILSGFQSEQIEIAYAPLLTYRMNIYELFRDSMLAARAVESASFIVLQTQCQMVILDLDVTQVRSAALGNALRQVAHNHSIQLETHLSRALHDIREFLRGMLLMSDLDIVRPRTLQLKMEKILEFTSTSYWLSHWSDDVLGQVPPFSRGWEVCAPDGSQHSAVVAAMLAACETGVADYPVQNS